MRHPSFAEPTNDDRYQDQSNGTLSPARLSKDIIYRRDIFGRTILHICVLANDSASFRHLLRNPEIRHIITATDYENGWNILHYIFYHKRLRCFSILMLFLDSRSVNLGHILPDLLRRKDRSRIAPLSLLHNDAKDLFWVPQYINEKNEFHLARRFSQTENIGLFVENNGETGLTNAAGINTTTLPPVDAPQDQNKTKIRASDLITDHHDWWSNFRGGSDVFVLGTNANDNLGMGDSHDRAAPSRIRVLLANESHSEDFSLCDLLRTPRYRFIEMSKYHSVLGTTDGKVYTCGTGSRGRLGLGNASNSNTFREVSFPHQTSPIVACAVSNNHSIALTASGCLYGWGQNTLNQLGFTSSAPKNLFKVIADVYENSPVEIFSGDLRKKASPLKGVEVSKIHTIAYTSHSLFFWGLNIGQILLPHEDTLSEHRINDKSYQGTIVKQPNEVQMREEIKFVATCETCTCVVTTQNDLFIHYMGQRVKLPRIPPRIGSESSFDFFKPSKLTVAPIIKKIVMKSHAAVHILLESGDVMFFGITSHDIKTLRSTRYTFAWSASELSMRAVDIDNSFDGSLIVCTRSGSVLIRSNLVTNTQRRGSFTASVTHIPFAENKKYRRLQGVNRVLRVSCNDAFTSFAFIRDEIDRLPIKLQKNDFFKDMEYLSPLSEPDMYRKQDQLLDLDHNMNCYITDFIYPSNTTQHASDIDNTFFFDRLQEETRYSDFYSKNVPRNDLLLTQMLQKFSFLENREPDTNTVFQKLTENDRKTHCKLLRHNIHAKISPVSSHWQKEKFGDGKIEFAHDPDFAIGIHTGVFRQRSPLFREIITPRSEGEYFVHQHIKGKYIPDMRTILFESSVEPLAVLVFVHFVYTNTLLDFWSDHSAVTETDKKKIAQIRFDYFSLMTLFKMDVVSGKDHAYLKQFQCSVGDEASADVTLGLSEMATVLCSSSIIARSAFFETILSGRWETDNSKSTFEYCENDATDTFEQKFVGLENISKLHMTIVLKHLQGCHDLHVFDEARDIISESKDSDDFVNLLLELIEVADELLLVQLKHLCELAIKDFINIDNVLILLSHAEWLGAKKLFMSCCWYVYHNLELILFDSDFSDLGEEILQLIEVQLSLLDKCKHPQFVISDQGEVDWEISYDSSSSKKKPLFETFLQDICMYNEAFMSDAKGFSKFEPLVDVKPEVLNATEERRKSSARKMSRKGSGDVLSEFQKLGISETLSKSGSKSGISPYASDYSGRRESDSAIADDEDFEVVTSKKRKSKSRSLSFKNEDMKTPETTLKQDKDVSKIFFSTPLPYIETPSSRRDSVTSRSNVHTPALGEESRSEKKQTKIRFTPTMKVSQKERRKIREEAANGESRAQDGIDGKKPQEFRNPWKFTEAVSGTGNTSSLTNSQTNTSKNLAKLNSLPILGQKTAPVPKLSAIILEETTRLAEQNEPIVTQTLQEIQQEQEFAKWWEEECRRVQQEEAMMNGLIEESKAQSSSKKGGKSRRGRSRRENQS